jgi:thiol-disulfide isomerase/thioredoxin
MRWVPLFIVLTACFPACRPAAAPVAISNRPVSINDVPQGRAVTKPFEQMSWTTIDEGRSQIKDLRNKVVVLDFWATYCPPCRDEIPHLNALQTRYGNDRLQVVGLNVGGPEDRPKIAAFVQELKVGYPIGFPEDALIEFIFDGNSTIPQTAVFDRDGRLIIKFIGFDRNIQEQLDRAVEKAVLD